MINFTQVRKIGTIVSNMSEETFKNIVSNMSEETFKNIPLTTENSLLSKLWSQRKQCNNTSKSYILTTENVATTSSFAGQCSFEMLTALKN